MESFERKLSTGCHAWHTVIQLITSPHKVTMAATTPCVVCMEDLGGHKVTPGCHHSFHLGCWVDLENHCEKSFVLCPMCRFECPRITPRKRVEEMSPRMANILARFYLADRCIQYVIGAVSARERFIRTEAAVLVMGDCLPRLGMPRGSVSIFIDLITRDVFAPLLAEDFAFGRQMSRALAESFGDAVHVPHISLPGREESGGNDLDGFEREFTLAARRRSSFAL